MMRVKGVEVKRVGVVRSRDGGGQGVGVVG